MTRVVNDFERYAETNYLPAVKMPNANDLDVLAGLRFIESRRLEGYQKRTREIFTTRLKPKIGREIYEASLAAMITMEEDRISTARFLVRVATRPRPLPTTRIARDALQEYKPEAVEALLGELGKAHPPERLERCAKLLHKISRVAPPNPHSFWRSADQRERQEATGAWRHLLSARGTP